MIQITGVDVFHATFNDAQRYLKCKPIKKEDCNDKGLQFPITCSCPPCEQCSATPCQGLTFPKRCNYKFEMHLKVSFAYDIDIIIFHNIGVTSTEKPTTSIEVAAQESLEGIFALTFGTFTYRDVSCIINCQLTLNYRKQRMQLRPACQYCPGRGNVDTYACSPWPLELSERMSGFM